MQKLKYLTFLPALLAVITVSAQNNANLTLSDEYPSSGEKIHLTYNPAGTIVAGKQDIITAEVVFMDNKNYPAADIDLKKTGKLLGGDFTIPLTAKAFYIKIHTENITDNNSGKGYVYMVYKYKQPVQGAYASKAEMLGFDNSASFYGVKTDKEAAVDLYKKEFSTYPTSLKDYGSNYYFFLISLNNPAMLVVVDEKIAALRKVMTKKI